MRDSLVSSAERLQAIQSDIERAAQSVQRAPNSVTLVAVSKTFDSGHIRPFLEAGHRVFGENRVQEATRKWTELKADFPDTVLHLLGPLQTNKVRAAVQIFDTIQTLDRPKLAIALKAEMDKQGRHIPVYVQVNTGSEPQKAGLLPEHVDGMIQTCQKLGLIVQGLMCIPPIDEESAVHFGFLSHLAKRNGLSDLSMGMSADYETAVSMGATVVRVGSALFGSRTPAP